MNDPTAAIVEFLQDTFIGRSEIKAVYDSDPDLIPTDEMPCITVDKQRDNSQYGATGYMDVTEEILVKVILDKQVDWSEDVDHEQHVKKHLRRLVEARTDDGRSYAPGTLRHALTNRLEIEHVAVDARTSVEYRTGALVNESLVTAEAHLTISCSYSMRSPTRVS